MGQQLYANDALVPMKRLAEKEESKRGNLCKFCWCTLHNYGTETFVCTRDVVSRKISFIVPYPYLPPYDWYVHPRLCKTLLFYYATRELLIWGYPETSAPCIPRYVLTNEIFYLPQPLGDWTLTVPICIFGRDNCIKLGLVCVPSGTDPNCYFVVRRPLSIVSARLNQHMKVIMAYNFLTILWTPGSAVSGAAALGTNWLS